MKVFAILAFIHLSIAIYAQNPYRRDENGGFILSVGDELPSFEFVTLNGDTLDSDVLRSQICIIQFVASWCPYSQGQMRAVEDLIWKKYKQKNNILVVAFTEDFPQDTAQFRRYTTEQNITYPLSFDTEERVFKLFATSKASVTRLIITDKNGKIVSLEDEFYRKSFNRTRKKIKELLK